MDEEAIEKYLTGDFQKAVDFYDTRAKRSKLWYRVLSIYLIVVAAVLTAVLALSSGQNGWREIALALSASIVVATGLLAHLKCHENWLSYRFSWDALERERRLFETRVAEYESASDPAALFVRRVEAILTTEAEGFYARHAKDDEQTGKPADRG